MSPPPAKDDPDEEPSPRIPQQRIIESGEYPMRVLAGAGTGKTFTMVRKIEHLIDEHDVSPERILALTFTNKAAAEMRGRIEALLEHSVRGMWVGTFHGIAHRLLRTHWEEAGLPQTFQILDADDQLRMVKRVIAALDLDVSKPKNKIYLMKLTEETRVFHAVRMAKPWKEKATEAIVTQ